MPTLPNSFSPALYLALAGTALVAAACSSDDGVNDGSGGSPGAGGILATGGSAAGGSAAGGSAAGGSAAGGSAAAGGSGSGSPYTFCQPADACPAADLGDFDLTVEVKFRTEIYDTYFRDGCGGTGCHGLKDSSAANLYFGTTELPLTTEEISALITQLTTTASYIAPSEKNVVPGDWQSSFLVTKLDGCQNHMGLTCNLGDYEVYVVCKENCGSGACAPMPCGDGMPVAEAGDSFNPIPFPQTPEERVQVHKVRAWIAQGALDN